MSQKNLIVFFFVIFSISLLIVNFDEVFAQITPVEIGSFGTSNGQFDDPFAVEIDSDGNIYVADNFNFRLQKFNSSGIHIKSWGERGTGDSQFLNVYGLAFDSKNNLYVIDGGSNDRIQKFSSDGTFITKWDIRLPGDELFLNPIDIAIDSKDIVYIVENANNRIQVFDSSGNPVTIWGSEGSDDGKFQSPTGIAIDSLDMIYVLEFGNKRVQKFDNSGSFITKWGSEGSDDGQFIQPSGITVDSMNNVYVSDTSHIQKFTDDGSFITKWGSFGSENDQFNRPGHMTVDSLDRVYVADSGNHRISIFSQSEISTGTDNDVGSEDIDKYVIKLKTRDFVPKPSPENSIPLTGDKVYHLRQFENIPTSEERKELLQQGITLHSYVGGNAYIASSEASTASAISPTSKIKFIGTFNPEDKISKELLNKDIQPWARIASPASSTGFDAVITIQFNGGVDVNDAIKIVKELGGDIISSASAVPIITASIDVDFVNDIANEFTVQYLDVVRPGLSATNNGARESANITPLKKPLYDLAGEGIIILVYDVKVANGEHPDFDTRVIESDPGLPYGPHSTHVAGTVGGSGLNSDGVDTQGNENGGTTNQWAGMAPKIQIRTFGVENSTDLLYDSGGDLNEDFATAIEHGIDLATMSLGNNVVPFGLPCELLGDYTSTALLIDSIVTGSIDDQKLIFVQSAGNERNSPTTCGEFATISSPATSKNGIVVGAINSNDNSITHFTSYGPTDDGRLKPDIVAPGCEIGGGITSTGFTRDRYWTTCGTSMSTPVTSGVVSLLLEKWKSLHDSELLFPHTVKAILIHTAIDGDNNAGPDYKFGWGILDAQAVIDLAILDYTNGNLITVDSVEHNIVKSYEITSDGTNNVKVTLAWDDRFGTQLTTKSLVNDLNLRLTDPSGMVYEPYILNPDQPEELAITGNDDTNNVEMIIGTAKQGEWIITVTGALVPFGPQEYTLIMTDIPIEANFEENSSVTGLIMDGPTVNIFPTTPISGESMGLFVVFEDSEDVNYDIVIVQEGQTVLEDTAYQHDGRGMHTTSPLSSSSPVDVMIIFQGYGNAPMEQRTGPIGEEVVFFNVVPEFGTLTVMLFGMIFFSILIISMKFKIFTNMQIFGSTS